MQLSGKVAVITGSSRGLGRAAAEAFARAGASVVVSSRSRSSVDETVEALRAAGLSRIVGVPCDVSNAEAIESLAARADEVFGRIDIWINNAGLSAPYGKTVEVPPETFVATIETNVLGTYLGSRVALQRFLAQGHGKLINLVGRGARGPVPMQNAYGSSKAWIRNFTRALAKEYRQTGVDVFAFQPGLMLTDLVLKPEAVAGYEEKLAPLAMVLKMWGESPEVVARKLVWLASDRTNGRRTIEVSTHGGLWMLAGPLRALLRKREITLQPRTCPR